MQLGVLQQHDGLGVGDLGREIIASAVSSDNSNTSMSSPSSSSPRRRRSCRDVTKTNLRVAGGGEIQAKLIVEITTDLPYGGAEDGVAQHDY